MYINKEKLYSCLNKVNGFPYDGICDLYIFIIEAKASFVSSEGLNHPVVFALNKGYHDGVVTFNST